MRSTDELHDRLLKRFLDYARRSTQSDETNPAMPSTASQLRFMRRLQKELRDMGVEDLELDAFGILYARLPATVKDAPSLGFCAHVDTVDVGLSPRVRPQVLAYAGKDLVLNEETGYVFKAAEHPELEPFVGEKVVFSDGTSVLGADDKAGVAAIVTMLEELLLARRGHGEVYAAFFPDEEIGLRGGRSVDLARYRPDYSFTVDGCALGEVEYETFNAAAATIVIEGVSVHPGSAKGVLVNPVLVAADIVNAFDRDDAPENSEGYQGYFWVSSIEGDPSVARLRVTIRDFDRNAFEQRKRKVCEIVRAAGDAHPRAKITLSIEDSYANIADSMRDMAPVQLVGRALQLLGVPARSVPVRGGTDGSAMSARGLPTPNIFTGGLNPHAAFECLPVRSLQACCDTLLKMVEIVAGNNREKDFA